MRLEFVNKINSKDEHYGLDISSNGCVKTTVLTRYHSNMVCDPPGDIGTNMGEVRPRSSDIGRDQDASRLTRPISLDSANSPSSAKSPADTYHIIIIWRASTVLMTMMITFRSHEFLHFVLHFFQCL